MINIARGLFLSCLLSFGGVVVAQEQDSVFENTEALNAFLDEQTFARNFPELIAALGGRDEYTKEQLDSLNTQLWSIYPDDFENRAVLKERDLAAGFHEEIIVYWTGLSYLWVYMLSHETPDNTIVISFNINSNSGAIFSKY